MLDFSFGELALVVFVALIVVGPKELPALMRTIGKWIGQVKLITDEFKQGFSSVMQGTELENIKKDLHEIHEEIKYIKDAQGNFHPIYDISHVTPRPQMQPIIKPLEENHHE